jgi:hypothetical protein
MASPTPSTENPVTIVANHATSRNSSIADSSAESRAKGTAIQTIYSFALRANTNAQAPRMVLETTMS